jgi:hypothetical protein
MCCLYSEKVLSDNIDFYTRFFEKARKYLSRFFKLSQETHTKPA